MPAPARQTSHSPHPRTTFTMHCSTTTLSVKQRTMRSREHTTTRNPSHRSSMHLASVCTGQSTQVPCPATLLQSIPEPPSAKKEPSCRVTVFHPSKERSLCRRSTHSPRMSASPSGISVRRATGHSTRTTPTVLLCVRQACERHRCRRTLEDWQQCCCLV